MSINDEQEIYRLFHANEELRKAVKVMQSQLAFAEALLNTAKCNLPDVMSIQIWENKHKKWLEEFNK
jgi:hypothetical protein